MSMANTNTPARLLNFISEQEVEDIKKKRSNHGDAVESNFPERPLYEILKENKDKQQAEFNERFKHQPPKALDEDETEFLEILDKFKKEQELLVANEEAQQLLAFQLAVANRTTMVRELTSSLHNTEVEPLPQKERKPDPVKAILSSIRVKPQPKKAKIDNPLSSERVLQSVKKDLEATKSEQKTEAPRVTSLVSYGTDSEDDQ